MLKTSVGIKCLSPCVQCVDALLVPTDCRTRPEILFAYKKEDRKFIEYYESYPLR